MKKTLRTVVIAACMVFALGLLAGCSSGSDKELKSNNWNPEVKTAVNEFLDTYGNSGKYVVFDFDNTTSIFDVENQLTIYQLQTMAFEIQPNELTGILKTGLTDLDRDLSQYGYIKGSYNDLIDDICGAYEKLWNKYGPFQASGLNEKQQKEIQSDEYWMEFATKMRVMYDLVYDKESSVVACPWILFWFSGMTEDEIYTLACTSHKTYSALETSMITWTSPEGMQSKTGSVSYTWTFGVSVSEELKELWKVIANNGIDIWVCSASGTAAVRAAIDTFGLHDYCTGMLAMTIKQDENGLYTNAYDYETGCGFIANDDGSWSRMDVAEGARPQGIGKVTAIQNAIMPRYNGESPIAGFMDSTGDFNFCTEFSSLKLVICFNRANRKVTDGGGLIAELAVYQADVLGYDLKKANENGDTFYVLQGRNENGKRTLRNSRTTLRYGSDEEKLFANDENAAQYNYMKENKLTTKEILDTFALKTGAKESKLGFAYGFISEYAGYHSK